MARRYSRDNRGRFASGGSGATARGGRLKTASGNTRATKKRIIPSKETRKTGPAAFDAAARSGKINAPVKFGGEGQGYKTPRGKAAAAASRKADAVNRSAMRRSGLPASGGAMRVKGGIKRDPGAAAKLASKAKPVRAAAKMRRQNARIGRAQANVTRNADVRNSAVLMSKASFARKPSKKTLKSQLRADRALAFYASPAKALRDVNKRKPGFRLPRGMR